eukprot:939525-Alexandrium_andersonii.AAC.1
MPHLLQQLDDQHRDRPFRAHHLGGFHGVALVVRRPCHPDHPPAEVFAIPREELQAEDGAEELEAGDGA